LRRHEELLAVFERTHGARQNADQRVVDAVEANRAADHVRLPAETLLPEPVADDDRRRAPWPAVRFFEAAADRRLYAEQREIRRRHDPASQALGDTAVAECHRSVCV